MRKRTLVASAALLATTLVAGCSSSGEEGGVDAVKGISVLTVTNNGRVVRVFDPSNGKLVLTRNFSIGEGQQTLADCHSPGELSAFTPDYSGLAVTERFGSGQHVGILSATDDPKKASAFKDLSGDTENKGKPVAQSTGAFGPDDKLYTLEQNSSGLVVRVINPKSGDSEKLNQQPSWTERDESGNPVTKYAAVTQPEDSESSEGTVAKPYFLPRGTEMEVDPTGHKVYSTDGKWAFEAPDDAHMMRGNLQTAKGERYTVDMPKQPDGSVDPVSPVLVKSQDDGVFASQYGANMYFGTFGREELRLTPLTINAKGTIGVPVASPDNKALAYVDTSEQGSATLHVATLNGKAAKVSKLGAVPGRSCVLGWNN